VAMTDTAVRAEERKPKGPIVWLDMDQTELDNPYDSEPAAGACASRRRQCARQGAARRA